MRRYKRKFEEVEKQKNLITYSSDGIYVQNPFRMNELISETFNLGITGEEYYNLRKINPEAITELKNLIEETNEEINNINEVLYNYILSKVTEMQIVMIKGNK